MELIHITDPHFGCADAHALAAAEKFIADCKPDAVIVSGDLSREGLANELDDAFAWMAALPAPVVTTPGNHDVPYHNIWGRLFDPFARFRRSAGIAASVRLEPWHDPRWSIVPVNTARGIQPRANWAQGQITRRQIRATADELAKAAPGALKIVVTHHPLDWPEDAPIKGKTWNGRRAQKALIEAGAQLFLSGHLHFASARLIGGRALSVTSGTLSQRVRHEPCALTVIRRPEPGTLETEIVYLKQGVAESASVRRWDISRGLLEPEPAPPDEAQRAGPAGVMAGE